MIVVTGGAGFIGSVFLATLNEHGFKDILLVDEFETNDKWKNTVKRQFNRIVHKNEFIHILSTDKALANAIQAVVHLGACSATTERDVDFLVRNNLNYSMDLFRFCAEKEIPYIYSSSAATYGRGELGYVDCVESLESLRPINAYGWSKQKMDEWALRQTYKPPFWTGLKFFNVYGPNEYHKGSMMSLICKAVPQIKKDGRLRLFKSYKDGVGHGEQKRDFVYVKDVADVIYFFLEKSLNADCTTSSGIFNVGSGRARSFADLGRATFSAMGQEPNFEWVEMPSSIRGQYQYFTEASLDNLREKAGYQRPFHSLEDGIIDYVKNYLLADDQYL